MNKEELLKAIMELPKVETDNPISTMNSINVDDLMSAVDRLNKVPDYNDLLKENQELKQKYLNAVADYVHKDTLTATDYVELNKDNELLMSYNQALLKENNELKKQLDKAHDELYSLKNKYNIRLLNQISENIEPDCEDYYLAEIETKAHKYDLTQNQQKEFIKYLEDEKDRLIKETSHYYIDGFDRQHSVNETIYDEVDVILQKYRSITGVSDEKK